MKKTFALILSIMLGLSSMSGCSTNKSESPENQPKNPAGESAAETTENNNDTAVVDWANIYADYIIDHESDFTGDGQPEIEYISVNDLNFDGTPELIVSGTAASAAYYCYIFKISENKVIPLDLSSILGSHNSLYSNFSKDWITLRKSKNTGEFKYVITSQNGGSDDVFGNIISFCADSSDKDGHKITNEFEYLDFVTVESSPADDKYYVSGYSVSESEYNAQLNKFYSEWQDTGFVNYAMTGKILSSYTSYPKTVPMNLDKDALMNFFAMYQPEK